ncbi:polysaccharide deacetylase family protein [Fibrobacter sp.]|uniref:polysaccharide deacetylase family protein n=1 Tax=Fibrobacter sp. TaxID=35828 RepID=UPI00388CFFA8
MSKKFLLCFHDFSVWNYQSVVPVLESLKDLAGCPFSVLVIPSTEGADESAVAGFRSALAQLKAEGFELALHGFKHKAEFSQGRSYMGLVGMNLTGGEAEFAGLSQYESTRLLQSGLDAWNELLPGLAPSAFVPPTWYSNKFLPGQVMAARLAYEDRFSVTTAVGRRYASPVVSFAGIPKSFEKLALAFGGLMLKVPVGLPRIALHPCDFPRLSEQVRDLIRAALNENRKLVHYNEL